MHEPTPSDPVPPAVAPEPAPSVERIALRRPPRVRPLVLAAVLAISALVLSSVGPALWAQGAWDGLVLVVFGVLVMPLGLVLFTSKAPGHPVIELGDDRMRLPITTRAHEFVTLRYRDITELFVRTGQAGFLWIGTPRGTFAYPLRAFSSEADVERVLGKIRGSLEPLPDWDKRNTAFTQQQTVADQVYASRLPATKAVLLLMALAFIVQALLQAPNDAFSVVGLGANVPFLVKEGQLFRIPLSNFLHVDPYHLIMNGVLILWLGGIIERLFGARLFALVAVASALLAPAASALEGRVSVSVGISGVAFGLLGAFAFTTFRMKGKLPLGLTPPLRLWLTLGILLAFMSIMTFGTDFPNHLGGFLAGVLVVAPALEGVSTLPHPAGRGPIATALLGALGAALLGGIGWGIVELSTPTPEDETRALADYIERQPSPPPLLNQLAWFIAIDPEASPARLEQARKAAHIAVSRIEDEGSQVNVEDTLATVYYRLGQFDEAIDREARVLADKDESTFAAQLARFLRGRLEAVGPRIQVAGGAGLEVKVRHHGNRGFGLDFTASPPALDGHTAWWLVERDGELEGLLRLPLGPKTRPGATLWLRSVGVEPVWHEGSTLRLAWVQAEASAAKGWLMDPEALKWP